MAPALTLDQLAEESDVIFKGEAIEINRVQDEWFKDAPGYETRETRFKIISKIKGEVGSGEVSFLHYDENAVGLGLGSYNPQFYISNMGGLTSSSPTRRQPERDKQGRIIPLKWIPACFVAGMKSR